MKKMQEFIQDMKDAFKKKDVSVAKEKYVKPAYEASKNAANATWNYIVETTPIVIAAGKEAFAKGKDEFNKMQARRNAMKAESKMQEKTEAGAGPRTTKSTKSQDNNTRPPST